MGLKQGKRKTASTLFMTPIYIGISPCGVTREFKDEYTKKLWIRLHAKKCDICKNNKN